MRILGVNGDDVAYATSSQSTSPPTPNYLGANRHSLGKIRLRHSRDTYQNGVRNGHKYIE
jgi:hypothetical protein